MHCWYVWHRNIWGIGSILSLRGIVSADKVSQLSVNDDVSVKIGPQQVMSHCSQLAGIDPGHPQKAAPGRSRKAGAEPNTSVADPVKMLTASVCQPADFVEVV